jgi:GMP synthase (glutamine-hydrolysing)
MLLILDFGSQYSQLIARKIRALHVYCQILPFNTPLSEIRKLHPAGIIFSGGPASVREKGAPRVSRQLLSLHSAESGKTVPVLGICYGMQLLVHLLGGEVKPQAHCEYGRATMNIVRQDPLLRDVPQNETVWMSHMDAAVKLPREWQTLADTAGCGQVAVRHRKLPLYGVQFHPEVHHSAHGEIILRNFALKICGARPNWTMTDYIEHSIRQIREQLESPLAGSSRVKSRKNKIVCAVSGGVDSTVLAALCHRAAGDRFLPVFVDNGLLRDNEAQTVVSNFKKYLKIDIRLIDARSRFLRALKGITDPEQKRKIIGREFVNVFFKHLGKGDFLAQGTLYPDVIESVNVKGPSATIKTHHNRVQEIMDLMAQNRVIEPLRELFKDEVRELGLKLGIPRENLWRQPFPGPGLAVRILGEITNERLAIVRAADKIVIEEIKSAGLYQQIWQSFAVLLPVKAVGVMGDMRTYANVIAIRSVDAVDGMTADFTRLPWDLLGRIGTRIINEVPGVNRCVYDVSSKPPSTIEWE